MAKAREQSSMEAARARIREASSNTHCNLSSINLEVVPDEIGDLAQLTSLDLSYNHLDSLPASLANLSGLRSLIVSNNSFHQLPEAITRLSALRTVDASHNQLAKLPDAIGQLRNLGTLDVSFNQLSVLPETLGDLCELVLFDASMNQLRALPAAISRLTKLTKLLLWNNQLTELPEAIGRLAQLNTLGVANNRLVKLPNGVSSLTRLEKLYLSDNILTDLPETVSKLERLEVLALSNNQLQSLPKGLRYLPNLRNLELHGNPKLGLSKEILGEAPGKIRPEHEFAAPAGVILNTYFARREQGDAPLNEVKIMLVGRGRVGKTSILRRLKKQAFDLHEQETPGITVETLLLKCPGAPVRGHAWDFGGQEFLHSTHQIFLSERSVYLLVLEGRTDLIDHEIDYWLRFIESFGRQSPVIVVLNKYSDHPFSVDEFRLRERCPQIVDFVRTDCSPEKERGIDILTDVLTKTVDGMKTVRQPLALGWLQVKERLAVMPESFVEYSTYRQMCSAEGIADEEQQTALAYILHHLGIALNFRDHTRLRDTSVLKPKWVTEGIYRVIRYVQKQETRGILRVEDLHTALPDEKEYPPEKRAFILELMGKFEVAFPLERGDGWNLKTPDRYLIPELLPAVQPDEFLQFKTARARNLRYLYPAAQPAGLIPRLIVRTHTMSEGHPEWRWKNGVVLEWQDCKALVRTDPVNRIVEVKVIDCPQEQRQGILDILRAHFKVLHGDVQVREEMELQSHPDVWVDLKKYRNLEIKGRKDTDELAREELVTVPVLETLDQVESPEARRPSKYPLKLFVSYSHKNRRALEALTPHLTLLGQRGYIEPWDDRQLLAGEEWDAEIRKRLELADVIVLIISTEFLISRYVRDTELRIARERWQLNKSTIIRVALEKRDLHDNDEQESWIKRIQAGTRDGRPISDFRPQKDGWYQVEKELQRAIENFRHLKT